MTCLSSVKTGTSGWHYSHWQGVFYPASIKEPDFLGYYAQHFDTVEINNTFYRLPSLETLRVWYESVPDDFLFAVKASQFITHRKKLTDPNTSIVLFFDRIAILAHKLGPILFQLPPQWHVNIERLSEFLKVLPKGYRYVFEFRDPTWFIAEVYELLSQHHAACCLYNLGDENTPEVLTTDFVYIRMHGPKGLGRGNYPANTLAQLATAYTHWAQAGKQVYCYFNNDESGYAVSNATALKQMLVTSKPS